jgi:hypothetical protein
VGAGDGGWDLGGCGEDGVFYGEVCVVCLDVQCFVELKVRVGLGVLVFSARGDENLGWFQLIVSICGWMGSTHRFLCCLGLLVLFSSCIKFRVPSR